MGSVGKNCSVVCQDIPNMAELLTVHSFFLFDELRALSTLGSCSLPPAEWK